MFKTRETTVAAMLCLATLIVGAPASAQTATPTVTPPATATPTATCTQRAEPPACAGAKKVQLTWFAKDPLATRVFVSATGCPAIPSCDSTLDGELVSVAPVTLAVTDAANQSLAKTVTDPGVNTGGCPGGIDSYRGVDRLRFVFGADGQTTLIGKLRVSQSQPTPPAFSSPLVVTVRDACGSLVRAVVSTCFAKTSLKSTSLKCF
jgi:hypothetical protein